MQIGAAELDLIDAVSAGPFEVRPWQNFLAVLARTTDAQFAVLNFRPPGSPFANSVTILSGAEQSDFDGVITSADPPADPPMVETLEEGRLYAFDELLRINPSREMRVHAQRLRMQKATNLRHVRVREPSGINAWLTVVRKDGENFDRAIEQTLTTITHFLRLAFRNYVALELERYNASLIAQAVRGMFGWITLDPAGLILGHDEQCGRLLANGEYLRRTSSGRLAAKDVPLEREIYAALARILANPSSRPQAITLSRDPWLDMLIAPARRKSISVKTPPAAIVYVHGDNWGTADRLEQLAQLFRLSPGEARLALALCRGMTISEAAAEFGLAVGTARNYCKSIFSKTGARGQPDLVRIIMRSVLSIAPDV
ncbi:MAG: helix-turn-helix transcriptional regulator [Novosphingobium sp.]